MNGPSLPLSLPLSSLPYLRSSKQEQKGFAPFFQGTKEETDGREVQTFCYPFGKLLAGFPWLALPWPWALADSSDAGDSFTRSSSASIVEIRGKDLKEGFFLRKIEQNISIVKQRAKPSRIFHPLSLILIDITSNLCRWTRSQPKIRYTSHIHNRCIFELIHRTDLVTHLCQGSELLRRKVRCCEAFKLECWNQWHHMASQ